MELTDKIKQIKDSRLKPEEKWFLDLISDLKEFKSNKCPDSVFWKKDGVILFEQNFNTMRLWVDYDSVWLVFIDKYDYKYDDIQLFIKNMVDKYLNWNDFTSQAINDYNLDKVDKYLNWNDFTPYVSSNSFMRGVNRYLNLE